MPVALARSSIVVPRRPLSQKTSSRLVKASSSSNSRKRAIVGFFSVNLGRYGISFAYLDITDTNFGLSRGQFPYAAFANLMRPVSPLAVRAEPRGTPAVPAFAQRCAAAEGAVAAPYAAKGFVRVAAFPLAYFDLTGRLG